jgi:predicted acyl esterase
MTQPLSKQEFSREQFKKMLDGLKNHDDVRALPYLYVTTVHPEKNPLLVDFLLHPNDGPFYWERSAYTKFDKIKIPCFITSRWNAWYVHLPGATSAYLGIDAPKRLMIVKAKHAQGFERPWHENQDVALRWYDHWLKGIDTGMMDEPPIKLFVQGMNRWRYEYEWPLARTKWTKFYLRGKGLLSESPPDSSEMPVSFTTKWIIPGEKCPCVKYETVPLVKDMEVTGPSALYIHASLSSEDGNFIVYMKDVGADGSETMVSKGWLKASHREIDESKSKSYQPFHPHTKSVDLMPGRIYEYAIEIRDTSYLFKVGHKVRLVIQGQDAAWEDSLISYHLTRVKDTQFTIYNNAPYPSYLILPIIPDAELIEPVCPDDSGVCHK